MEGNDSFSQRPRIAHITNHGYGGVVVPTGGAPDTGGQNVYVNAVVKAMVELGYHVTVFARGGFPFFESERIREGIEPYGEHARYVYVPGGGDEFIRKEDIAVALDEEVDWLAAFIGDEAEQLGCQPWEVYEIVNTHYWDAGVMGMNLAARWRSLRAHELTGELLGDSLTDSAATRFEGLDPYSALGVTPEFFVGDLLFDSTDKLVAPAERVRAAIERWGSGKEIEGIGAAADRAVESFKAGAKHLSPSLTSLVAADVIGQTVLELSGCSFEEELIKADRHVFTPHSLGVLKEENYREKPLEVIRNLKFCERRNHEVAICRTCRAFAATSTEIADRLRTHLEVPMEKVFFFPPCVDRSLFAHYQGEIVDRSYAYLANKTGVPEAKLRASLLIYETSRMDRTKRKDLLLEAFAKATREYPDAYLLIGGGPQNDIFKELEEIRQNDPLLVERAFLLGFVPDEAMYPLFDLADIFVSGSEMEGFGMSVAQAAAVGTPIVTSHLIPFAVQYVPDDALIVEAGDVDGFAWAMLALLSDEADRKRRGERLESKTAELDWVVQSEAFLEHLRNKGMKIAKPRRES
jgi:glycosyltransferase involved in cell wall biosynthesis